MANYMSGHCSVSNHFLLSLSSSSSSYFFSAGSHHWGFRQLHRRTLHVRWRPNNRFQFLLSWHALT